MLWNDAEYFLKFTISVLVKDGEHVPAGKRSASGSFSIKALWRSSTRTEVETSRSQQPTSRRGCRQRPTAILSSRFNQGIMTLASLSDDELVPRLLLLAPDTRH